MSIRAFLAIPISPKLKNEFEHILVQFSKINADVKWVKPDNLHLTVKFLGNIEIGQMEAISMAVKALCVDIEKFDTNLSELGAFPDLNHPQVLWAALDDSTCKLQGIVQAVEEALEGLGFTREERPFKAHITLGRVRSSRHLKDLLQVLKEIRLKKGVKQCVEKMIFYKSTLTPEGPMYEVLKEFSF